MNTQPGIDGDVPRAVRAGVIQGRRRLLRGSVGVAPVLLTISSGPVIAGNHVQSASAKCSASTSAPTRGTGDCNGWTHTTWSRDACDSRYWVNRGTKSACKTSGYTWPCAPTTLHHGGGAPQVRTTCNEDWSLTADHYQVMNRYCARSGTTVDKYWANQEQTKPSRSLQVLKLAAHCSAALLNCEKGLVPKEVCTQDTVRSAWEACKSGGTWTPPASSCLQQSWTSDEVCNWFSSMCTT
jgi:hypothetical protein